MAHPKRYYKIQVKKFLRGWETESHGEMEQDQAIAKMWEAAKDEEVVMVRCGYITERLTTNWQGEFYKDGSYIG